MGDCAPGGTSVLRLIQILLPLQDKVGQPFPADQYDNLAHELTERFGGVTSFTRSPGEGRWKQGTNTDHDDVVVIEVMTDQFERDWWSDLRERLMREFKQADVVIRVQTIERL
jgi:hypothetical protein